MFNPQHGIRFIETYKPGQGKFLVYLCALLPIIGLIKTGEFIFFALCFGYGLLLGFSILPIVLDHQVFISQHPNAGMKGWNKEYWKSAKRIFFSAILFVVILPYAFMLMAFFAVGAYFELLIALLPMAVSNLVHVVVLKIKNSK